LIRKLPFIKGLARGEGSSFDPGPRESLGFSLIELVLVIVIISLLMVFAASRLMALRVDAERVAMEVVLGTLRSALGIKVAETLVKHEMAALGALEGSNPMDRLAELPTNYLGEFDKPNPSELKSGNWYYDRGSRALVYVPQHVTYFTGGMANPPRARFAITLVYADKNKNCVWDSGVELVEGVRLTALEPYRWTKASTDF
jgi:prepilin-type N-terminal cleavage/methylation domain-containing protein